MVIAVQEKRKQLTVNYTTQLVQRAINYDKAILYLTSSIAKLGRDRTGNIGTQFCSKYILMTDMTIYHDYFNFRICLIRSLDIGEK